MDEEIIRLDLKQAKENGFEYYIEYEPYPVTFLSDDCKSYKNLGDIAVIKKRRITTASTWFANAHKLSKC